ncbi:unnamed protein product [Caenorhabditis brenneri]
MSFWNQLPPEIKQHVVKKLDLVGRSSLRCASRYHRTLVDSTKHYIPRVRYDLEGKYPSMTFYHGIDDFYKLFFKQDGKDVQVARQENDYDPQNADIATVKNKDVIPYSIELLTQFLSHKSIRIGTMEANIDFEGHLEFENDIEKVEKVVKNQVLRADKLIFPKHPIRFGYQFFIDFTCIDEMKTQGYLTCWISSQNQVPVAMYFDKVNSSKRTDVCKTDLFMLTPIESNLEKAKERLLLHIEQYDSKGYPPEFGEIFRVGTYCEVHSQLKKGYRAPPPSSHRWMDNGIVMHTRTTKCGQWTNMYQVEHEKKYLEKYKDEKCGLGILCPRCSDPFDYWYHQILPKRLLHVGESFLFFKTAHTDTETYNRELDLLTKKLQESEDQKEKLRSQKNQKNQKKKKGKGTPFMEEGDPFLLPVKEWLAQRENTERIRRRLQEKFTDSRSFLFIVFGFGSIFSSFLVYFLYSLVF